MARSAVSFLQRATADPNLLYDIELLLTEACSNVILHSYERQPDGDIEVRLELQNGTRMVLELSDWGAPYAGPAPQSVRPDPHAESGRGVYIISHLADVYSYERSDGRNILRIEKELS